MLVPEVPVHHASPVKADVQDEETLSLQEGEDVFVPEVPVHHASPVKADVQDKETYHDYNVFQHEPLGQEQIKYMFLHKPLDPPTSWSLSSVPFLSWDTGTSLGPFLSWDTGSCSSPFISWDTGSS